MIRFGISGLPPEDGDDAAFLDAVAARGHQAYRAAFVHGFPWKERRCRSFGELAAERGIALSVHAPYFAVLTVDDDEKRTKTLSALEHTMKLGRALGAHTIVAHTGYVKERTPDELHELVDEGLQPDRAEGAPPRGGARVWRRPAPTGPSARSATSR